MQTQRDGFPAKPPNRTLLQTGRSPRSACNFLLPLSHKILANSTDRLFNKILAISSTIPTFVQNYSFSKYIAKMLAPKSQYSLLIAKMFAPKSQYSLMIAKMFAPKSQRTLASFGDCRRAIFEKCFPNLTWIEYIDFNEFVIYEIVLIRAFQRAIKGRDTISGTLISSFKRQLAKILWNRGSNH